ncbi:MAG: hypothetical protein AB1451_16175 [Nitrospirota bacterium]
MAQTDIRAPDSALWRIHSLLALALALIDFSLELVVHTTGNMGQRDPHENGYLDGMLSHVGVLHRDPPGMLRT